MDQLELTKVATPVYTQSSKYIPETNVMVFNLFNES